MEKKKIIPNNWNIAFRTKYTHMKKSELKVIKDLIVLYEQVLMKEFFSSTCNLFPD